MRIVRRGLFFLAVFLNACLAHGDLLYFSAGGRAELAATRSGQTLRIDSPIGPLTFEASEFRKIVSRPTIPQEWPERLAQARKGSNDDRFAAAWWALENGLTPEAVALLREIHEESPRHEPTARLCRLLDEIDRAAPDPDLSSILKDSAMTPMVERGKRALVLHQGDPEFARRRLDVVERVETTFLLVFAARGVEVHPSPTKLVSLWYKSRDEYVAFLNRSNAGAFRTSQGYYHPTHRLVVGFEASSSVAHLKGKDAIERRRRELDDTAGTIESMPQGSRLKVAAVGRSPETLSKARAKAWLARERRDLARPELLLELDRLTIDLGLTAHETVHQLIGVTGFLDRHDAFPTWLHEGLAAQFEVVRSGRWAGVGRANDARLPDWRNQGEPPRLAPLLRDEGFGQGYRRDHYARAWSLVYYLRIKNPDQFVTFLDLLKNPRSGATPPESNRTVGAFRKSVGDLATTEADWRKFLETVETPLEAEDPGRKTPPKRD